MRRVVSVSQPSRELPATPELPVEPVQVDRLDPAFDSRALQADAREPIQPVRNLLAGTMSRYALLVVNIGLGVVLMPFTVRHLGTTQYGLWMLVASLTYYFQLLDLGFGNGVVRHVTEADARGDIAGLNRILSTFALVYAAIGMLAAAGVGLCLLFVIPRFPNLQPDQVATAQWLLAFIGFRVAIGFPICIFGAVINARQRFAMNNSVAIASAFVSGATTYLVLASGFGLVTLVGATTAVNIAAYGAYAWNAWRVFPQLSIRPSLFRRDIVRDVAAFSVYFFLIDIAVQIGFNLDNIIIGGFLGTAAVAVYALALRIADYQRQLSNQLNGLLFPVIVRFDAGRRSEALRVTLVEGTRISLALVIGVTICVIGFGRPLVALWMGPSFAGSVLPLYVLALTGVVLVSQGSVGSVLLGTGRHRFVAAICLAEALANLALSIVLVRRLGILGVAVGTCVPVAIANLSALLPAACRSVGLSVWRFARLVIPPAAVGAVPAILVCGALRVVAPPASLKVVIGEGAIVWLTYVAGLLGAGLGAEVRTRYRRHLLQLYDMRPALRLRHIMAWSRMFGQS